MIWQAELELAVSAARKAGATLHNLMSKEKTILSQSGKDIKLQADCDAESIILQTLAQSEYPVLTEESGEHGITDGEKPFWVVDPLDGTFNFSRGLPICCVSIALCRNEEALLGVIYDFSRDECFQAAQGQHAQLNGDRIHVSNVVKRSDAVLSTGFPSYREYSSAALDEFISQVQQFKKVRLIGSAALSLAYVACGRVDAYAEDDIMLWDIAAGVSIVELAGGYVELRKSVRHKWGRIVRCASSQALWDGCDGY